MLRQYWITFVNSLLILSSIGAGAWVPPTSHHATPALLRRRQSSSSSYPSSYSPRSRRRFSLLSYADNNNTASDSKHYQSAQQEQQVPPERIRRQIQLNNKTANVLSRQVSITDNFNITVWEWEKPAAVVETYWQVENQGLCIDRNRYKRILDPFGLVTWPGSVVAVQELIRHPQMVHNKSVLLVGAGVGVEAQAVAQLGACKVLATDIHPTTLQLLRYGAEQAGLNSTISTEVFDLFSYKALPSGYDLLVIADVLYNDRLAGQVVKRCVEAYEKGMTVLVSDTQRFCATFEKDLNQRILAAAASKKKKKFVVVDKDNDSSSNNKKEVKERALWHSRYLHSFTGSGVAIDIDQTYDVKARIMWIGLKEENEKETIDTPPSPATTTTTGKSEQKKVR